MLISGWRSAVYLCKIKVRRIQSEILKCQLETWLSVEALLLIRTNPSSSIFKPFYSIHFLHTTQVSLTDTFHCSLERMHVTLTDSCRAGCDLNFSCRFLQAKVTLSQNLTHLAQCLLSLMAHSKTTCASCTEHDCDYVSIARAESGIWTPFSGCVTAFHRSTSHHSCFPFSLVFSFCNLSPLHFHSSSPLII